MILICHLLAIVAQRPILPAISIFIFVEMQPQDLTYPWKQKELFIFNLAWEPKVNNKACFLILDLYRQSASKFKPQ